MTKVERVRVGDVLTLMRRPVGVDPAEEYREIGIRSFGKGIFHKEPLTGADLGNKRVFRIEPGDLVISNVFAWEGAISVASDEEAGMIGSHRFMTFVPKDDQIEPSWAAWFLLSEPGLARIGKASPGSAGRNRTLAIDRFENLEIPLPPIDEQRRVAAQLDRIQGRVARVSSSLLRAQSLSDALRAAVSAADGDDVSISELVAQVKRPVVLHPTQRYTLLGCRWYGEGLFVRECKTGAEIAAPTLYEVKPGDLVYNRLFAWKGSFALAGFEAADALVSGEFPTFEIDRERVMPEYLIAALEAADFLDEVDRRSAGGTPTSRNRLKEREFLQIRVPVPDLDAQSKIAALVGILGDSAGRRRRIRELAEAMVPSSLNQAFAGLS